MEKYIPIKIRNYPNGENNLMYLHFQKGETKLLKEKPNEKLSWLLPKEMNEYNRHQLTKKGLIKITQLNLFEYLKLRA